MVIFVVISYHTRFLCFLLNPVFFQKLEGRMASDFDLKLSDTLRYYSNDTKAALDLLYRRSKALANYEQSNKVHSKPSSVIALLLLCTTSALHCSSISSSTFLFLSSFLPHSYFLHSYLVSLPSLSSPTIVLSFTVTPQLSTCNTFPNIYPDI